MAHQHRHPKFLRAILASGTLVLSLAGLSHPTAFALQAQTANASAQVSSSASASESAPRVVQVAAVAAPQNPPVQTQPTPSRPSRTVVPQGTQYGQAGFVGEPINLNVVNADIRDILNYITEQYGVNFIIDKSVGKVPVTINVTNVPWNVALDSILRANGLGIEVNGNILRVAAVGVLATEADAQRQVKEAQLDNSPLVTEFIRLNYARASGTLASQAGSSGDFAGGQPSFVAVSPGGASQQTIGGRPPGSQQIQGGGLLQIIRRRLSRRGGIEVDERSNTLIVTDVKQNLDAIRQLVALLDQPEPQVEIETRIVVASRNFSRDLGVQLQASVFGRNGKGISFETATAAAGLNPNNLPGGLGNTPPAVGTLGVPNPSTVIGLTTGIFGTAQIGALITAAENKGEAKTIATPRVTAMNNRPAQIETGQQIAITTAQAGASAATGGAALFTTTYISVPLRLSVTPQITDAGTVLMRVTAENNSINTTIASVGAPGIDTQRMQTEVLVPDGGTTVIGGTLSDNESNQQFRTPGLGTLPIVGNLFKRRQVVRQSNEILFFITPRIYRPDYQGRPVNGTVSNTTRSVQIPQPVPLGNPPSNNDATQPRPETQVTPQGGAPSNSPVAPAERP